MDFGRIRVWRHLFGGDGQRDYGTLDSSRSLQAQAELRSYLNDLQHNDLYEEPLSQLQYAVIDTETTGFSPQDDKLLSVAAVLVNGRSELVTPPFQSFVAVSENTVIPKVVQDLTGINVETLSGAPKISEVLTQFLQFVEDRILIAHHAGHDIRFLNAALRKSFGIELNSPVLDTGKIAMLLHPFKQYPSLDLLLSLYEVPQHNRHSADGDAWMTARLFMDELAELDAIGVTTLGQVWERLLLLEQQHLNK